MVHNKNTAYFVKFIGFGIVLWFIFLVIMRLLGPSVFATQTALLFGLFIATIPLVVFLLPMLARLSNTPTDEMILPVVIMNSAAVFLDSLSLAFTNFYGNSLDQIAASGAYLLWGVSMTSICAIVYAMRGKAENRSTT